MMLIKKKYSHPCHPKITRTSNVSVPLLPHFLGLRVVSESDITRYTLYREFEFRQRPNPILVGVTVSADIFCAEITAGKSQQLKEITTAVGKSKHEF
jgi:hypothetical protein